jgi:AhpD family alkylhydroperoxidase
MDDRIKELIAIGASVAGHCQPCLTFHIEQSKRLGVDDKDIVEAVNVGKMVQKGAMAAMNTFTKNLLEGMDGLPETQPKEESPSKKVDVYDPAMCCSSGVCGPKVDSALVEFASLLKAVASRGIVVERWNLSQQPQAFVQNLRVKQHLQELGNQSLPFIYIDGELKWTGRYPSAKELFSALELNGETSFDQTLHAQDGSKPLVVLGKFKDIPGDGPCCSGEGCCS